MLLTLLAAQAATYTEDLIIPANAPVLLPDTSGVMRKMVWDTAVSAPDTKVDSDWSYVTCGVTDGAVWALFHAGVDDWPTTIPSTATCTHGTDTLVVNIVQQTSLRSWDYDINTPPGQGYVLDLNTGDEAIFEYHLPATQTYVTCEDKISSLVHLNCDDTDGDGVRETFTKTAWLAPRTPWAGIRCDVGKNQLGTTILRIAIKGTAAAGVGFCRLKFTSGNFGLAEVTLNRL